MPLLVVSHVADNSGASRALVELLRNASRVAGGDAEIVLAFRRSGALLDEYKRIGEVVILGDATPQDDIKLLARSRGCELAFVNTSSISELNVALHEAGLRVITWIHEMPWTVETYLGGASTAAKVFATSERVLFLNDRAAAAFTDFFGTFEGGEIGTLKANVGLADLDQYRTRPKNFVLGTGEQTLAKGFDHFCNIAAAAHAARARHRPRFVWVGDAVSRDISGWAPFVPGRGSDAVEVHNWMPRNDFLRTLASASVLFVSSREDTRPLVALEAMALGTPVIAFEGATTLADEFPIWEISALDPVGAARTIRRAVRRGQRRIRHTNRTPDLDASRKSAEQFLDMTGETLT